MSNHTQRKVAIFCVGLRVEIGGRAEENWPFFFRTPPDSIRKSTQKVPFFEEKRGFAKENWWGGYRSEGPNVRTQGGGLIRPIHE